MKQDQPHAAVNPCVYYKLGYRYLELKEERGHTRQKTFVRVMLSHQNLLHTLYLADFLHNLTKQLDLLH